MRLKGLLTGYY